MLKYLEKKKILQEEILKFLDDEGNKADSFQILEGLFKKQNIHENRSDITELLHLILQIANEHHRSPYFYNKIDQILLSFKNEIKQTYSNSEIVNIFQSNNRILYFLSKEQIISKDVFFNLMNKSFMSSLSIEMNCDDDRNEFNEKVKEGENDNFLCRLIRRDLIDDFITYVNQNNIPLSSTIETSIFETNPFLNKNKPNLIEYTSFYGSIQIFKYLYLNKVKLNSKLWIYSIHGRNPEIIHLLEENNVQPENKSFAECLIESIKCHHNEIANYIRNNFIDNQYENEFDVSSKCFEFYNYFYFPNELVNESVLYDSCRYGYESLVRFLLNTKKLNVNEKIVLINE